MLERPHVLLCVLAFGCAGIEPKKEPPLSLDAMELFRRARFLELSTVDNKSFAQVIERLRPKTMTPREEELDFTARRAYRMGDGKTASAAIVPLPESSKTRQILSAFLANVELDQRLFTVSASDEKISLPLDRLALGAGYAVVSAKIRGMELRLLWDTGSTENVISEEVALGLGLPQTRVQFVLHRGLDALVVRFAATGVAQIDLGPVLFENVPLLVTELHTVSEHAAKETRIDGFLSPQLLLPHGCFSVDRVKAELEIAFDPASCTSMIQVPRDRERLFTWDGEVYVNSRIHRTRNLALQLETGSPVTYIRADASRYVPKGSIDATPAESDGEIAHDLARTVVVGCGGRKKVVSAIDLEPRRHTIGHDDLGTVGTDVLLQGRGYVVSFAEMMMGFLEPKAEATRPDRLGSKGGAALPTRDPRKVLDAPSLE
jgi:hypothetical protein